MKNFKTKLLLTVFILITGSSYAQLVNIELERKLSECEKNVEDLKQKIEKLQSESTTLRQERDNFRRQKEYYASENNKLNSNLEEALKEKNHYTLQVNDTLDKIRNELHLRDKLFSELPYPMLITEITVESLNANRSRNSANDRKLYAATSVYLYPEIEYTGLKIGQTVTLFIRLYRAGKLVSSKESPPEYSYKSDSLHISPTERVKLPEYKYKTNTWDKVQNSIKKKEDKINNWPKDNYRFEIWYDDVCLKSVDFTLH